MSKETVHVDASFEPLVPKFIANRKMDVATMGEALVRSDFESVRTLSHKIKGAGGSYGFDRITEIAAVLEQAAKAADAAIVQRELAQLGNYLEHIEVVYD